MLDSLRANGCCEPNSTYTPKHFILCSQYLSCDWKSHLPINMEGCGGWQTSIGKCLAWVGRLKLKQVDIQWLVATCLTQLHDQITNNTVWANYVNFMSTLCNPWMKVSFNNKHGKDVLDSEQTKWYVFETHVKAILHFFYTSTWDSHIWKITNASTCTTNGPIRLLDSNWVKLTNRTTSNWPSCAFLTFSSTCAHCSIRASLGAARKNVRLKVPRLRICWRCLYSRPISKLMHSRRSMILHGVLDDSAAFLDL